MQLPRSTFSYLGSSLARVASKPALIQRHRSLRGSDSTGSKVKKVRTRSMCETDPEANVSTSNEGQKGLFVTLEAADSAGCVFVFSNFVM